VNLKTINLKVSRNPPITILQSFLKILQEIFINQSIINFTVSTIISENHLTISDQNKPLSGKDLFESEEIKSFINFISKNNYIDIKKIEIESLLLRIPNDTNFNQFYPKIIYNHGENLVYDTIEVKLFENHPQSIDLLTQILESIHRNFPLQDTLSVQNSLLDDLQSKKISIYEANYLKFQKLFMNEKLFLDEVKETWNQFTIDTQKRLNRKFEEDSLKIERKFNEKNDNFIREQEAFYEYKKNFDDRERTVVRRDLLNKIEGIIEKQSKFNLSETTIQKRKIVNIICNTILSISGISLFVIIGIFIYIYLSRNITDWNILISGVPFSIIFGSTLIFYLRWTTQWYRDHAEIEFSNQIFSRDMLRASWIVEMFFEWREQKQSEIPEEIYTAISRNLFNQVKKSDTTSHPFEDILKFTNKFSKIKISKGGVDLNK
jgi:hypothetical protein